MNIRRLAGLLILIFSFTMGCTGNYGNIKTQSESDSKATQQELIDNWSDYDIWLSYDGQFGLALIVFDPKNDGKKILVEGTWRPVEDQETWTKFVKANSTSDDDLLIGAYFPTTRIQEIRSPDNQLYGFIIQQNFVVDWVTVKMVDENAMQLSWKRTPNAGTPL